MVSGFFDSILDLLDDIKGLLGGLADKVTEPILDTIGDVRGFGEGLLKAITRPLRQGLDNASAALATLTRKVVDNVKAAIKVAEGLAASIGDRITEQLKDGLKLADDSIDKLTDAVLKQAKNALELGESAIKTVTEKANEGFQDVIDSTGNTIDRLGSDIVKALQTSFDTIVGPIEPIVSFVTDIVPGLFLAIKDSLTEFADNIKDFKVFEGLPIAEGIKTLINVIFRGEFEQGSQQIDFILKQIEDDEFIGPIIRQFSPTGNPLLGVVGLPLLLAIVIGITMAAAQSLVAGELTKTQQLSLGRQRPTLLNPAEAREIINRFPELTGQTFKDLEKQGYPDATIVPLLDIRKRLLETGELLTLWLRDEIEAPELATRLGRLGWEDNEIDNFKVLAFPIPAVADLIRMSVREVFSPEIAEKFGQFEEIPDAFILWAGRQGLSEFWARNFWAAHWELPSLQMGFEMAHRNIITQDDLATLMVALDVMPFWRDKIQAIAFRPFTRVDIRRMHRLGILNLEEVKRSYLDLGYNEEKATAQTLFVERLNSRDDESIEDDLRELTKTNILDLLEEKIVTPEEAVTMLVSVRYSQEAAEALVSITELREMRKAREQRIKIIRGQFRQGLISFNEAVEAFDALNINPDRRSVILAELEAEKESEPRLPTRANLDKMVKQQVISETEYKDTMGSLGFSSVWTEKFLLLIAAGEETE